MKRATTQGYTFTQNTFDQSGILNIGHDYDGLSGMLLGPHSSQKIERPQNSILKPGLAKIRDANNILKKDHLLYPTRPVDDEIDPFMISHTDTPNVKVIKDHIPAEFEQKYRDRNEEVQMDYFEIKSDKRMGQTPMICVHGMFDSKYSFK